MQDDLVKKHLTPEKQYAAIKAALAAIGITVNEFLRANAESNRERAMVRHEKKIENLR